MSVNSLSSLLGGLGGGSSSPFNFSGIVSGLDTNSIINSMMAIERRPLANYNAQLSKVQARDQAYQDVKGKLTSLQSALQSLLQASAINVKSTAVTAPTGSNPVLSASATSDAVAGNYVVNVTQLATASSIGTTRPISKGITPTALLNAAGFTTTPTAGTFTINGVSITVNPTTDTVNSLLSKMTDSGSGGTGGATGVVATLVNDANGNPNMIRLTPTNPGSAIQLGSGSDTSNFLSVASLVATNVAGGTVQSSNPLSQVQLGNTLSTQPFNLATGVTLANSGSFTINNTAINWTNQDSLSTVLNRINTSQAGVRATYNAQTDQVSLTNLNTGNQAITVSETAAPPGQSGLLAALGLVGPNSVSTAGKTAQYTVATNGGPAGPVQYSNSNTVTGIPGVTMTFTATGSSTVAVSQNTSAAANNITSFVNSFNAAMDTINTDTAYDATSKKSSVLTGDSTILGIQSQLRSLLSSVALVPTGSTYKTLEDIGISTGAYGSAPGNTKHLVLDQGKLSAALQNNASGVFAVLSGLVGTTTITDANGNTLSSGSSWLQSISGSPTGQATSGKYAITYNSSLTTNNLTARFIGTGGTSAPLSGTITAGASSSLIAGMSITAKSAPVNGTEYVKWNVTTAGVLQNVNNYLTSMLQTGGAFDAESQNATSQTKTINNQITALNARLTEKQTALQSQFTAMEVALAKLQQQGSSLNMKLSSGN